MSHFSKRTQAIGLASWLLAVLVAAAIGSAASIRAGAFYVQMTRPEWAPPPGIFGPVWSVLYVLMGVAAWLVWRIEGFRKAVTALGLFLAQLVLNALWSWLFFGWHLGAWAFAEVALLWAAVIATLIVFWTKRPLAGWLLVPYLLWVSFAATLNYSVWQLNPHLL